MRRASEIEGCLPLRFVEHAAALTHVLEGHLESVPPVLRRALLDHWSHRFRAPLQHGCCLKPSERRPKRSVRHKQSKGGDVLLDAARALAHRSSRVRLCELGEVAGLEAGVHRQKNPCLLDLRPHVNEQVDEQAAHLEPTLLLDLQVLRVMGRAARHVLADNHAGEPDSTDD